MVRAVQHSGPMRRLFKRPPWWLALLSVLACLAGPARALGPAQLALVVNTADPASVEIAEIYRRARGIPRTNIVQVAFAHDSDSMSREAFERLHAEVLAKLPAGIEAFALAWTRPWRAGCMGITSAFAFGYDASFCSQGCAPTRASRYFDGGAGMPETLPRPRPAMLLAGESVDAVRRLIERGVASDFSYPRGTVYLVQTPDAARNVRARFYPQALSKTPALRFAMLPAEEALHRDDVAGYFTGAVRVAGLDTLRFLPGAPADHLTSFGGQLLDNPHQMSALAWLQAGATGSYGTVVEPCNHVQKFPNPGVLMAHYADGDTLIEAYWKSVAWPGEGVFIGEPLAQPWGTRVWREADGWWIEAHSGFGRRVQVEVAESALGPFREAATLQLPVGLVRQKLAVPESSVAVRVR